jgi:hypothetical protein
MNSKKIVGEPISIDKEKKNVSFITDPNVIQQLKSAATAATDATTVAFLETIGPKKNNPVSIKIPPFFTAFIQRLTEKYDQEVKRMIEIKTKTDINLLNDITEIFNALNKISVKIDSDYHVIIPSINEETIAVALSAMDKPDTDANREEAQKRLNTLQKKLVEINESFVDKDLIITKQIRKIKYLRSIDKYPQSSNIENYILLDELVSDDDINSIFENIVNRTSLEQIDTYINQDISTNNQKKDLQNALPPAKEDAKNRKEELTYLLLNSILVAVNNNTDRKEAIAMTKRKWLCLMVFVFRNEGVFNPNYDKIPTTSYLRNLATRLRLAPPSVNNEIKYNLVPCLLNYFFLLNGFYLNANANTNTNIHDEKTQQFIAIIKNMMDNFDDASIEAFSEKTSSTIRGCFDWFILNNLNPIGKPQKMTDYINKILVLDTRSSIPFSRIQNYICSIYNSGFGLNSLILNLPFFSSKQYFSDYDKSVDATMVSDLINSANNSTSGNVDPRNVLAYVNNNTNASVPTNTNGTTNGHPTRGGGPNDAAFKKIFSELLFLLDKLQIELNETIKNFISALQSLDKNKHPIDISSLQQEIQETYKKSKDIGTFIAKNQILKIKDAVVLDQFLSQIKKSFMAYEKINIGDTKNNKQPINTITSIQIDETGKRIISEFNSLSMSINTSVPFLQTMLPLVPSVIPLDRDVIKVVIDKWQKVSDVSRARDTIAKWSRDDTMLSYNISKKIEEREERLEQKNQKSSLLLRPKTIVDRMTTWLTSSLVLRTPVSYIYSRYSDTEKEMLLREKDVCTQISKLLMDIKKYPIKDISFLPSFYVKEDPEKKKQLAEMFLNGPKILSETYEKRSQVFKDNKPTYDISALPTLTSSSSSQSGAIFSGGTSGNRGKKQTKPVLVFHNNRKTRKHKVVSCGSGSKLVFLKK